MKKILFGTTALLAMTAVASVAQASDPIKLTLGGFMEYYVVGASQDDDFTKATRVNNFDVQGESEIYFTGETTLDNGMVIGAVVELEAGSDNNDQDTIDESYMYVSGKYGKMILGSTDNAVYLMRAVAPNASYMEADDTNTSYLLKPDAVTDIITDPGFDGDANKVMYMTPKFYGVQAGVSYSPSNAADGDDAATNTETIAKMTATGSIEDAWALSLTYEGEVGPVGLLATAGYTVADIYNGPTSVAGLKSETQDFSGGLNLTYQGFTLGGSVRRVLQPFDMESADNMTGWAWDAGLMYEEGPYAVSVTYRSAETEGSNANPGTDSVSMLALGGKYALGAGVDLFAQLAVADYDDEGSTKSDSNSPVGGVVGIHLDF
ncbi:MAG: porin [Rhodospirillaceae bacterium]|nr:porin [Rhodospirillaceae bacterium]